MKLITTFLLVFITYNSFCQVIKHGDSFKIPEGRYIGATSDKIIFWRQKGTYKSFKQIFEVVNRSTWEVVEYQNGTISDGKYDGYVVQKFVRGDYIFELVQFLKGTFTTHCKIGMVKRRISDFEVEGDIIWVGEYTIFNAMEVPSVSIKPFDNGFYLLSSPGEESEYNFITKYDLNFNEIWKKEINELKQKGIALKKVRVERNGNLLLELNENLHESKGLDHEKGGIKTSTEFIIITNDKLSRLTPKIDSRLLYSHSEYFYDYTRKELVGVYLITELDKTKRLTEYKDQGYAYYRWDDEGDIKIKKTKVLTYGDVWNNEARNYLEELGEKELPSNDTNYPRIGSPFIKFFQRENGNVIFTFARMRTVDFQENKYNFKLMESIYCFELNEEGEFAWKNFIPRKEGVKLYSWEKFLISNDNLYIINRDVEESFSGNSYSMSKSNSTKNSIGVITIIDEDGGIKRSKIENPKEGGKALYIGARITEENMLEYFLRYTDKKKMSISSINF